MLNSQITERKSNELYIEDVNGDTLKEMLRFIYAGKVENLEFVASDLLYAAEKYNLPELKSICADYLIEQLSAKTVFDDIILAEECKDEDLMEKCLEFMKT